MAKLTFETHATPCKCRLGDAPCWCLYMHLNTLHKVASAQGTSDHSAKLLMVHGLIVLKAIT